MFFKLGLVAITLLVGSLAIPTPRENDLASLFVHPDGTADASRIVGGTVVEPGSLPYMAVMTDGILFRSLMCGGSIVGRRSVLTAAHCIDAVFSSFSGLSSGLRVTVGTNRWNTGGRTYAIERNVTHPNWVGSNVLKNDIGLLITNTDIELSATVQPVPLSYDMVPGGVPVRAAGWGRIRFNGPASVELLELLTTTMDAEQCEQEVEQAKIDHNFAVAISVESHIEICTIHSEGHGNCHGDSGSALVRTDTVEQVGVVSWGLPCARGAPDMYARVSAFKDFLEHHIV